LTKEELNKVISGCVKNNTNAKETLYKYFARDMMYVCRKYTQTNEDAQDIHQECFIKVFDKIGSYSGEGSFEGWLKRLFINHCINNYKKYKNNYVTNIPEDGLSNIDEVLQDDSDRPEDDNSFDKALDNYTFDEILTLIDGLEPPSNLVFRLYYLDEQAHNEIAHILNISVSNSKTLLHRAKKKLYQTISKQVNTII
jgi:RNA polymerase sigma-70 factor, ECF subfamily